MPSGRSQFLLAILAIAVVCASPNKVSADVHTPPAPTITLKINDQPATFAGDPPAYDAENNFWQSSFSAAADDWRIENGLATFSNNAIISYSFDGRNFGTEEVSFLLVF